MLGWVACIAILLTCAGGLVSEISGVVGVGELAGVPRWLSTLLFDAFLLALVWPQPRPRPGASAVVVKHL